MKKILFRCIFGELVTRRPLFQGQREDEQLEMSISFMWLTESGSLARCHSFAAFCDVETKENSSKTIERRISIVNVHSHFHSQMFVCFSLLIFSLPEPCIGSIRSYA